MFKLDPSWLTMLCPMSPFSAAKFTATGRIQGHLVSNLTFYYATWSLTLYIRLGIIIQFY